MRNILLIHSRESVNYIKTFNQKLISAGWKLSFVLDTKIGSGFLTPSIKSVYDYIITDSQLAVEHAFETRSGAAFGNYVGSFRNLSCGIPIVVIPPMSQKFTVPYNTFLTRRILDKILKPSVYLAADPFKFFTPSRDSDFYSRIQAAISTAEFMSIDTETLQAALNMDIVGIATWSPGRKTEVFTWEIKDLEDLALLRMACESAKPIKIFQNGKYDCHYLFRFGIYPRNWKLDTLNMFNCWLAELPKDLAFISAFCVRDFYYWKDESKSPLRIEQLAYNAKDCYTTLWAAFSLLKLMPKWAINNYGIQFPKVIPNLSSSLLGLRVDADKRVELQVFANAEQDRKTANLQVLVGNKNFNPNSSQQKTRLLQVLGVKDYSSADAKHIAKAIEESPLAARVLDDYVSYAKEAKLNSTYYKAPLFKGRLLWSLTECATDTGRNASKSSSFWCGTQIQNQPEGAKVMYMADEGWEGFEADFSQAESRCTGYLADDEGLIEAVENSPDFHSYNASKFFGIPFGDLWDIEAGKTKNKPIRDLAKRTNHGANYNMGAQVLVETMGVKNIWLACELLELRILYPKILWNPIKIATYLLAQFDKTYPKVRGEFQEKIIAEIMLTGLLAGVNGWTRRVFGDPSKSKPVLNAVVAHGPQNLSALTLNRAYELAWWALHNSKDFLLIATIHDSILGQYRGESGKEKLARLVEIMTIPITIPYTGKTFVIPPAVEVWGKYWKEQTAKRVIVPTRAITN